MVHISRADRHRMQQAVFVGAAKGNEKPLIQKYKRF